jgi:hypothetical protein
LLDDDPVATAMAWPRSEAVDRHGRTLPLAALFHTAFP